MFYEGDVVVYDGGTYQAKRNNLGYDSRHPLVLGGDPLADKVVDLGH